MAMKDWLSAQFGTGRKKAMPILSFPAVSLMGVTVRTLVSDCELQARGMKMIADRCPTAASLGMMDLSVEAEAFGAPISIPDDEVPTVSGRVIGSEADVDRLRVPSPASGRTGIYVEAIRRAAGLITDRPVFAGVIGPFSLAGRLMDMTEIMINCYEEPDMVKKTLEKVSEFLIEYIRRYKAAGAGGVVVAEPAAGLLSPELCGEFSSAYVKTIMTEVRGDDFLFLYHNCGNTIPLVDGIMGLRADAYLLGNAIDLEKMLELAPADRLIVGNVNPAAEFRLGTPESIRRAAAGLLGRCAGHPNFVPGSGCDIPPLSPWENIDSFFAAVDEFHRGAGAS